MRLQRPSVLISVVAAAALVLAGCGSDSPPAASGQSPAPQTSDSAAPTSESAAPTDGSTDASTAGPSSESGSETSGSDGPSSGGSDTASSGPGSASVSSPSGPVVKPAKLVIALVPSSNADTAMGSAEPLTQYLTEKLGVPTTAVVTKDYTAAVEAIGSDQAQAAFLPVLSMAQAVERYKATPALQVVRDGKTTYHTQFFTNDPSKYCSDTPAPAGDDGYLYCNGTGALKDGPGGQDAIAKIKGATIAYVEETSTSGYVFPALMLTNAGIDPEKDVEPIFAGSHDKAVLAVYNGDAEVGVSFDDARTIVKDKPDVGQKVVVFALSDEIPNDGVVTSASVDPSFTAAFSQALIDFSKTAEGKKSLDELYQITDFAPADPSSLAIVTEAAKKLGLG